MARQNISILEYGPYDSLKYWPFHITQVAHITQIKVT